MRRRHRWLHLSLLLAVLAGVFTMHTLGHPADHSASTASSGGHTAHMVVAEMMPVNEPGVDRAGPGLPPPLPTDPTSLCVAVLCATLLLAAMLALLRHRRTIVALRPGGVLGVLAATRGPPAAGIGLRLADLSVLRN